MKLNKIYHYIYNLNNFSYFYKGREINFHIYEEIILYELYLLIKIVKYV